MISTVQSGVIFPTFPFWRIRMWLHHIIQYYYLTPPVVFPNTYICLWKLNIDPKFKNALKDTNKSTTLTTFLLRGLIFEIWCDTPSPHPPSQSFHGTGS